ncbi:MAG: adenylate/guanylate cyclase domain-containing protein [Verrucomicrobia bacterium]|nr:adenylate/guanylate cyclase domain-containing protein [Verrucomicrobiota bacterium]
MRTQDNPHVRYNSLQDFLISNPLEVDGIVGDAGSYFPVKGREVQGAAILFADMSAFSARSLEMSPVETLIFVNNFFAWITRRGLKDIPGIVDKYIGDELMVVFAREFGSADPFLDAVRCACAMIENDHLAFTPHIGIASGDVVIGHVGTMLRYDCSVFGAPVALAARCAAAKPILGRDGRVVFPDAAWNDRKLAEVLATSDKWKLSEPHQQEMKRMPTTAVRELSYQHMHIPTMSLEERARESFEKLKEAGSYNPRRFSFK